MEVRLRSALPADHKWIVSVVDRWWGRPVASAIPRLFLDHFHRTSLVAELRDTPTGFLVGFMSPSEPETAYIHFVGVDPAARGRSIGRLMYNDFFELARSNGRSVVEAITSPVNAGSIEFHRQLGFTVSEPIDGYDRPGTAHVTFARTL